VGDDITRRGVALASAASVIVAFAAAVPFALQVTYFGVVVPMEVIDRSLESAYAELGEPVMDAARRNLLIASVWLGAVTALAIWRASARASFRQPLWRTAIALTWWAGVAWIAGAVSGAVWGGLFSIPVTSGPWEVPELSRGLFVAAITPLPWIAALTVAVAVVDGVLTARDNRARRS
jgi:hypothetical protein